MTLRRLRTAVCLLAVLSICTTVLPAWAADHDANTCAAGGGGGALAEEAVAALAEAAAAALAEEAVAALAEEAVAAWRRWLRRWRLRWWRFWRRRSGGAARVAVLRAVGGAAPGSSGQRRRCGGGESVGAVGPATNSVAPSLNGGIATGIGATIGGAGNGAGGGNGGGGVDAGGDPSGATALQGAARPYALRAIYFRRDQFKTTADCLTAAYTQRLPLEVCQ